MISHAGVMRPTLQYLNVMSYEAYYEMSIRVSHHIKNYIRNARQVDINPHTVDK